MQYRFTISNDTITLSIYELSRDLTTDICNWNKKSDELDYEVFNSTDIIIHLANGTRLQLPYSMFLVNGVTPTSTDNFIYLIKNLFRAYRNLIYIEVLADFPTAVNGVITLEGNATYFITTTVDLLGARLIGGQNTTIIGGSSENCRLKSTGLSGTALITSEWSLPIRSVTIEAQTALDLDAGVNSEQALDWFGVNFTDCENIGTIANYTNFIASDCGLLNSANLTFNGSIGTVGFSQCFFNCRASNTVIILPSTLTITRRFRIIYSAFVVLSGETGINLSTSASIPVDAYILDTVNFSGGGTYTSGVLYSDNKALYINCKGISNSNDISSYYMNENATVTDIITTGVAVKIAGTTTSAGITQRFTNTNNRATYTGALNKTFLVSVVSSVTSTSTNDQIGYYVAKNGVIVASSKIYVTTNSNNRAESVSIQGVIELITNDYIEVWIENKSDTSDVTVTDLNVIIRSIN